MVLEGGSIAIDDAGTLITTEQCLLNANRNPSWTRAEIEDELIDRLGVTRVVWLGQGLVEDRDTDGHVDLDLHAAPPAATCCCSTSRRTTRTSRR